MIGCKRTATPVAAVVMVLAVLLAACGGGGGDAGGGQPAQRMTLKMGMASEGTFTAEWWGWLAARELGYYDQQNLDVEFVATGGSGDAIEQLAAGNLDAANPSMPSVAEGVLSGLDLVDVYTYSSGAIFGIFATGASGITDIPGLAGKRIGVSVPGGGEVAFLEAALRRAGIDPISGVQIIPIGEGGPETYAAITSGQVDAYSTAYNDIFALQTQGVVLADLTPPEYSTFPARGIITTSAVVEEKADALQALARGTAMGTHYCINNNQACIDMLRAAIPEVWETNADGVSQGQLRFDLSLKQVPPRDPARYGAHDEPGTRAFFDTIASTLPDAQTPDLGRFLDTRFLDYANDFDRAQVAGGTP